MKILSDLSDRLTDLQKNTSDQIATLQQQLYEAKNEIQMVADDSLNVQSNLSRTITQLNLTVQLQLHNISKMEGPVVSQNVPSVNLTLYHTKHCRKRRKCW